MQRPNRKVFQGVFNALLLGAVSLGAGQALAASPADPIPGANFCSASEQRACVQYCDALYGPLGSFANCARYPADPVCTCEPY